MEVLDALMASADCHTGWQQVYPGQCHPVAWLAAAAAAGSSAPLRLHTDLASNNELIAFLDLCGEGDRLLCFRCRECGRNADGWRGGAGRSDR